MSSKEFGLRLRNIRIRKGMSQEQLAKAIGLETKAAISKIELGVIDCNSSKIQKIAKALGVNPSEFFCKSSDSYEEYLPYLAKASEGTLASVRKLLDMPEVSSKSELEKKSSDKIVG